MAHIFSFEHSIALPVIHRIQKALRAFFRTSEAGVWTVDPTQRDDETTLQLIRGNWETSDLSGIGGVYRVPGYARWLPQHGYLANTVPMLLNVTVAESDEGMQIQIKHTALPREPGTELREICETAVDAELKSLAKYLKQAFHLPSAPEVTLIPSEGPTCAV
jgi:hypothetical protein